MKQVYSLCSPGGGRKPNGLNDINRIETFNHANKGQTEFYIVDMLLWLNHLINRSKITANVDEMQSNTESPKDQNQKPSQEASHVLPISSSDDLVLEQKDATIVKCIEGCE